MSNPTPLTRKILYSVIGILLLLVIIVAIGEVSARMMGYQPPGQNSMQLPPEVKENLTKIYDYQNKELGWTIKPGTFDIVMHEQFRFTATHGSLGTRITTAPDSTQDSIPKKDIWVFGCSFTYGWGVNDSDTYVWKAQQQLPEYRFVNFGTPGYGTVQNLIQLKQQLEQQAPPGRVILAYAVFHDERNILSRRFRKNSLSYNVTTPDKFPKAALDDNGNLKIEYIQLDYTPLPFSNYLAFDQLLENKLDSWEHQSSNSQRVSQLLIQEMHQICQEKGIEFYVMSIREDAQMPEVKSFCEKENIPFFDASFNMVDSLTNAPFDAHHPNGAGHSIYAEKLVDYLKQD